MGLGVFVCFLWFNGANSFKSNLFPSRLASPDH